MKRRDFLRTAALGFASGMAGVCLCRMANGTTNRSRRRPNILWIMLDDGRADDRRHVPPPWLRVRALDPNSLVPVEPGTEGLLAFFDLANAGSVAHVLTEDVGTVTDGAVRLRGRSPGAEPRGCSLAIEELLDAAGG